MPETAINPRVFRYLRTILRRTGSGHFLLGPEVYRLAEKQKNWFPQNPEVPAQANRPACDYDAWGHINNHLTPCIPSHVGESIQVNLMHNPEEAESASMFIR